MLTIALEPPSSPTLALPDTAEAVTSELVQLMRDGLVALVRTAGERELADAWRGPLRTAIGARGDLNRLIRRSGRTPLRPDVKVEQLLQGSVVDLYRQHLTSNRSVTAVNTADDLMDRLEQIGALEPLGVSVVDRYLLQLSPAEWETGTVTLLRPRLLQLGYLLRSLTAGRPAGSPKLTVDFFVEPVQRERFMGWSKRPEGLGFAEWMEHHRAARAAAVREVLPLLRACPHHPVEVIIQECVEDEAHRMPHDRSIWADDRLFLSTAGFRLLPDVKPKVAKGWTPEALRDAVDERRAGRLHQQTLIVTPRSHQGVARPRDFVELERVQL